MFIVYGTSVIRIDNETSCLGPKCPQEKIRQYCVFIH